MLDLRVDLLPKRRVRLSFGPYAGPRCGDFGNLRDGWVEMMRTHPLTQLGQVDPPEVGRGMGRWVASNGLALVSRASPCTPLFDDGKGGLATGIDAGMSHELDEWAGFTIPGHGRLNDGDTLITGNEAQAHRAMDAVIEHNRRYG